MNRTMLIVLAAGTAGLVGGCVSLPDDALAPTAGVLEDRSLQCRKYATDDEALLLSACTGVLQDLGFLVETCEVDLGLVGGSKIRSARNAGNMATAFALGLLTYSYVPADKEQEFRASITTLPAGRDHVVRVTFQRVVWDSQDHVTRREPLKDPEFYREFFDRLSTAVAMEAQQL